MIKISTTLKLKPVQVYKWRWDRHEAEKRRRGILNKALVLPAKIFYITKIKRKQICKQTT